ncbi:hypothetical protein B0T25DRAFT_324939 [Lasiosphaeria hispida]|uniref:Protamine P1 n=1 Tax=Lasiosphaeria hispida TaxID=260671 RepID=A0AAJ0M9U6_9PEZI|nr:hypothetical protein B0T25DRAFT_324939 [Lasiosphaeria hispida]
MRDNTATRMGKLPPPSRDRDWLQPECFANEPIYCEAQYDSDDVLYSGSDDEAYDDPAERRILCEQQAQRYLMGKPTLLLSASLQGPFDRESGWKNPWRSRSGGAVSKKRKLLATPETVAEQPWKRSRPVIGSSCHLLSPKSSTAQLTPHEFLSADIATRVRDWRDTVVVEAEAALEQYVEHVRIHATPSRARPGLALAATSPLGQEVADMSYQTRSDRSFRFRAKPLRPKPDRSVWGLRNTAPPEPEVTMVQEGISEDVPVDFLGDIPGDVPEHAIEFAYEHVPKGTFENIASRDPEPELALPLEDIPRDIPGGVGEDIPGDAPEHATKFPYEHVHKETFEDITPPEPEVVMTHEEIPEDIPEDGIEDVPGDVPQLATELAYDHAPEGAFEDIPEDTPEDTPQHIPRPDSPPVLVQSDTHLLEKTPPARMTPEGISGSESPPVSVHPDAQMLKEAPVARKTTNRTAFLMDGPTLVPSKACFGSGGTRKFGIGHFSFEKKAESFTENILGLPGKLLWPKSQQPAHTVSPSGPATDLAPRLGFTLLASAELGNEASVRDGASQSGLGGHSPATTTSSSAGSGESERPEGQEENAAEQDAPNPPSCPTSNPEGQSPQSEKGEEIVDTAERVGVGLLELSPTSEMAGGSRSSPETQSPWTGETLVVPLEAKPKELPLITSPTPDQAVSQSPWAKGDSQVAIISEARPRIAMSSPAISCTLPEAVHPDPAQGVVFDIDIEMSNTEPLPPPPSTPEPHQSSLPTPEFTLSIKSFREFMTPSPVRVRRISTDGRLPSTQLLVDAAVSNPWARPSARPLPRGRNPRKPKRVSWAPLPREEESQDHTTPNPFPSSSPAGAGLPIAFPALVPHDRPRASSPPPSSLVATDQLPMANEKFSKHFAVMANRRRRSTTGVGSMDRVAQLSGTPRIRRSLLPSASQQVCGSPAVEAMAEAFLQADETVARHEDGVVEALADEGVREALGLDDEGEGDITLGLGLVDMEEPEEEPEEEPVVDDVTAVLNNLDDFLDHWDVDVELAKAGREKERQSRMGLGGELDGGLSQMGVGVWD